MKRRFSKEQGMGLVLAIFLIVVGGMLTVVMGSFMAIGQGHVSQNFQAVRALAAADSGLQIAVNEIIHPGLGPVSCLALPVNPSVYNLTDTNGQAIGCSATVTCNQDGSTNGNTYYSLESIGQCGVGNTLQTATRRLSTRLWSTP
ncbi:hypothetical protein [Marinobacterium jannaschii]|uniref:hypothetical protein n=1 Tax=Marinobacterium jannaschii TaxID=64970 RepID=UPI000481D6BB|nr:hypothetical protein [Marinobacterium jannaschii]